MGKLDKAVADFSMYIKLDPENQRGYLERGRVYSMQARHDDAIADFSSAIDIDGNATYPYLARGYSYYDKGEHAKTIKDCDTILSSLLRTSRFVQGGQGAV
jgi:tetratricopeptide (TPR) repeat protein